MNSVTDVLRCIATLLLFSLATLTLAQNRAVYEVYAIEYAVSKDWTPVSAIAIDAKSTDSARFALQPGLPAFPSARDVVPIIHASVSLKGSTYSYAYDVSNGRSAKQPIDDFFVLIGSAPIVGVSQPQFWGYSRMTVRSVPTSSWGALVPSATISPGQGAKRFTLTCMVNPGIVFAHASGVIPPDTADDETEYDTTEQNELSNSVTVTTIGPVKTPGTFRPLGFLDTMDSEVSRSRSMGWIANQPTANKYTNYMITTRSQLRSANISGALSTLRTVLTSAITDSTSLLSSEAYALIWYNTQHLIAQLQPSFQVKGGVFNPQGTSTLSVRAEPDSNFTSSDTLVALTATIRWQSRYTLTLGPVSSPIYGFSKYGTVTTVGSYNYQQFRTATHVPLNWTANTEYELFTVPVNGSAGVEEFTLTNALSGGQWFVDIDYLDKTDSIFYQPVATCTGR